ncbi:MAG: HepT-like ribonuclease domain-containing protein [Bacteroidota bacterium]
MTHEIYTWLEDINIAIIQIYDFLPEDIKYSDFENDIKTQKAIERNIEIIGEALNRILKVSPDIAISDSRKIVDTRNRIIHGYDSITPDILWLIIKRSLPILRNEVSELLK